MEFDFSKFETVGTVVQLILEIKHKVMKIKGHT